VGADAHIAGAGLAGSLLAVYLARRGMHVRVFERRPDMRRERISAGRSINLALANRGLAALARVGLEDAVRRLTIPMRGRMLHDERGNLQLVPYGQQPHEVIYSISRAGLNVLLMDAAEASGRVELRFNERVEDIDLASGDLALYDERTGERRRVGGAPVIAADGAGSVIRDALMARPGAQVTEDVLPHDYKELTIPPAADGGHALEKNALHIWPRGGYMLIALPNLDGSFTVTLFLPHAGDGDSFAALTTPRAVLDFFERAFPDAVPLMPDLVESFFVNPTGRMVTVRCAPWHEEGRALLIGDAAHAIVPFHGQGMNAAFEDCNELDRCLDAHDGDTSRAFAQFTALRKPDAEAIADMALENYVEMRDAVRDPRFQLQKALAFELERRHPGVFIPRYSMVMFHHIPYAQAQRRGALQQRILDVLTENARALDEVDLDRADRLVETELRPRI
jgi:kynurenine 3-monooxygenase